MRAIQVKMCHVRVSHLNITISHAHADPLGSINVASIRSVRGSFFSLSEVPTITSLVPVGIVESGGIHVVLQSRDVTGEQEYFHAAQVSRSYYRSPCRLGT